MPILRRAALLALATAFLLILHMLLLAGAAPVFRTLSVRLPGWPAGAPSMRVVLLSDTHVSAPGDDPALLRRTVARIDRQQPDLVLLAGDFRTSGTIGVDSFDPAASVAPLAGLRAHFGSYAVLGNHDYSERKRISAALRAAGVRLLDNEAVRIGPLALVAVSDSASHNDRMAKALASWRQVGGIPLAFSHSPDFIPALPTSITLALAGHTHCGQVSFPIVGAPFTQSRYGGRYACGIVREGSRTSIIGAGLGVSGLPIRLGAAPDLWVVTIGR